MFFPIQKISVSLSSWWIKLGLAMRAFFFFLPNILESSYYMFTHTKKDTHDMTYTGHYKCEGKCRGCSRGWTACPSLFYCEILPDPKMTKNVRARLQLLSAASSQGAVGVSHQLPALPHPNQLLGKEAPPHTHTHPTGHEIPEGGQWKGCQLGLLVRQQEMETNCGCVSKWQAGCVMSAWC